MNWKKILAYISGSVNDMLLNKVEYILKENKVLRGQLDKRVKLTDIERKTLTKLFSFSRRLNLRIPFSTTV